MPRAQARTHSSAVRPSTRREVQAGCILWLPRKEGCIGGGAVGLEDGCYDHPVVVLWTDTVEAIVLIITSFDSRDLGDRHPTNHQVRALHLPIRPSPPHPDNGLQLALHGNVLLRKKSYVKTERQFRVRLEMLIPYERDGERDFRLLKQSLDVLVGHIEFTPPPPNASRHAARLDIVRSDSHTRSAGHPPMPTPPPPSPSPAANRVPPPRRTRTYANVADLPPISPSPTSLHFPAPISRAEERRTQDPRMRSYLPYDERRPLIPHNVPTPEGGSLPTICRVLLSIVVVGILGAVLFYAGYGLLQVGKLAWEAIKGKWNDWFGAAPKALQSVKTYLGW